jgi:hypothetical protein
MWIPEKIDACHDEMNLPCTFIDSAGKNRSGFYTQFDLIALEPKKAKQIAKKTKKCQIIKGIFSLPSGEHKIIRDGDKITFLKEFSKNIPFEYFNFNSEISWVKYFWIIYRKYIHENILFQFSKDLTIFVVIILIIVNLLTKKKFKIVFVFRFIFFLILKTIGISQSVMTNKELSWNVIDQLIDERLIEERKVTKEMITELIQSRPVQQNSTSIDMENITKCNSTCGLSKAELQQLHDQIENNMCLKEKMLELYYINFDGNRRVKKEETVKSKLLECISLELQKNF